jgi:hypothetical protein
LGDLSEIQAAQSVKLIGSDLTALEDYPVNATPTGDLNTANLLVTSNGVQGSITVGTLATEAKVGASTLTNRKLLTVFHNGSGKLYWGFTSGVTTATGTQIFKNTTVSFCVSTSAKVYLISDTAGQDVRITEGA